MIMRFVLSVILLVSTRMTKILFLLKCVLTDFLTYDFTRVATSDKIKGINVYHFCMRPCSIR